MVATKEREVEYSSKLEGMIEVIRKYLNQQYSEEDRTYKGIEDFCFRYPKHFKKVFLKKLNIKNLPKSKFNNSKNSFSKEFASYLSKKDGECIFLLKDSFNLLKDYQKKKQKGFGIVLNRHYLFEKEEDYFSLIDTFYKAYLKSSSKEEFLKFYLIEFKKLLKDNPNLMLKSKEVSKFVINHISNGKIIWVDMGLQFTFCLFGYCSLILHSDKKIEQDFIVFSTYPWIRALFKDNIYSDKNEHVVYLELESTNNYYNDLKNKSEGAIVGFAIGDALGFPVAGIESKDVSNFIKVPITNFLKNKKHPYFSNLKKGNYTANTQALMLSANNIINNGGFEINSYQESLVNWGKKIIEDEKQSRWIGPTMLNGIKKLIDGKDYTCSGSITTKSCSATYRVIPIGISYRNNYEKLLEYTNISSMITHNSIISKFGAIIVSSIISNLLNGQQPEDAIRSSINTIEENEQTTILINKIEEAIKLSKNSNIEFARKAFGTGSPIYQTLPLAIFCFLKYQNNFKGGILAAANSFREDSGEEKERLKGLSWEEQLLNCEGGNTDGIAGLTGAFLGAYLGFNNIPKSFLKVEKLSQLLKISDKLCWSV